MPAIDSLTRFYGSFFLKCAKFAVCPYLVTAGAFINMENPKKQDIIIGAGLCIFLSTVVPILPFMTSITFAIASFGACLALASMLIAYPIALLSDVANEDFQPSF